MIFYDLENLKNSLLRRDKNRFYHWGRIQYTIQELVKNIVGIPCENHDIIRTYAYTGEYTKDIIQKIEYEIEVGKDIIQRLEDFIEKGRCITDNDVKKKKDLLEMVKRRYKGQQDFLKKAVDFNFFEMRTYPLKYEKGRIFQKGVDVQLAVDFVSNAYRDNFDIAVICSGDIDLLESLKLVKRLGKKVVIFGHNKLTAIKIRREADFFIDIERLKDSDLEKFSRQFNN